MATMTETERRQKIHTRERVPAQDRLQALKPGERVRASDPRHRTKGAKKGKGYRTSDRPRGDRGIRASAEMTLAGMNSRQRYKARRQAKLAAMEKNGLGRKTAPSLKGWEPVFTGTTLQDDLKDIRHESVTPGTESDYQHHLKTGTRLH